VRAFYAITILYIAVVITVIMLLLAKEFGWIG
jgi:hypothetical protein